jgi:hypothetical protein
MCHFVIFKEPLKLEKNKLKICYKTLWIIDTYMPNFMKIDRMTKLNKVLSGSHPHNKKHSKPHVFNSEGTKIEQKHSNSEILTKTIYFLHIPY